MGAYRLTNIEKVVDIEEKMSRSDRAIRMSICREVWGAPEPMEKVKSLQNNHEDTLKF